MLFGLSLDDRVEAAALFIEVSHVLGVALVGDAGLGFGAALGGAGLRVGLARAFAVGAGHFADAPCDDAALRGTDGGGHGERESGDPVGPVPRGGRRGPVR